MMLSTVIPFDVGPIKIARLQIQFTMYIKNGVYHLYDRFGIPYIYIKPNLMTCVKFESITKGIIDVHRHSSYLKK